MFEGACLCGTVRYEVAGPFRSMLHCHCSMCRKHHGAPFATYVAAPRAGFRWVAGEDSITRYASSARIQRCSCSVCGSVTPFLLEEMGLALCPAGNLEGELGIRAHCHLFVASKAPWYDITDSLPQHDGFPPEFAALELPSQTVTPKSGVIQGSCLCGGIAFEIDGVPIRLAYCHCVRCQRSRSAAHAANVFAKLEQFRWLAGESLVRQFKVPEAQFFTIAFCVTCGGGAPSVAPEHNIAVVPAGMLDTDPGIRPLSRIFVGSKASWVEITDALPRFEAMPPRKEAR